MSSVDLSEERHSALSPSLSSSSSEGDVAKVRPPAISRRVTGTPDCSSKHVVWHAANVIPLLAIIKAFCWALYCGEEDSPDQGTFSLESVVRHVTTGNMHFSMSSGPAARRGRSLTRNSLF